MKNKILITVGYLVEEDRNDFWDEKTGCVHDEISDSLEKRFPHEINLKDDMQATRLSLSYGRIDYPRACHQLHECVSTVVK